MKFKINNTQWEIKEISQKEIKTMLNKRRNNNSEDVESIDSRYYGVTFHDSCLICLDKDLPIGRKKTTLMHELTHCYITTYITHLDNEYSEEMVCDIVANSNGFINSIIKKYFKEV